MSDINTITVGGTQYNIGGGGGLLPHIVITSDAENTITVTTPSGSTITPTSTVSGVWECDGDEYGTYTITATYDEHEAEDTVVVDTVKVYAVEIHVVTIPDGSTVLPTDDIATWLLCADIKDKSYTTLNEVLADSVTYNALLGDSNACAYMKRSTTWTTDICADQYAMNLLGQYDTACDALLSDSTWASAIANSTYADSVISALVPIMTSNTTPSGVAFASSTLSGRDNYRAFDGNPSTDWSSSTATYPQSIGYQSPTPMCVKKISFTRRVVSGYTNNVVNVILQGSNDGQTWSDIGEAWNLRETDSTNSVEEKAFLNNSQYYSYHQLKYLSLVSGSNNINPTCVSLQFYGHAKSGEKIHGGNPTYDSFYRIVDGNNVPVTDPSLLDAGTYTIYSNGLAKDPDNLSNDYGKTVRICPNTKEIVVRPDFCLSWLGYLNPQIENVSTTNGWSCSSWSSEVPTYNEKNITYTASSSRFAGIALKQTVSASGVIKSISKKITNTDFGGLLGGVTTKALSQTWTNYTQVTSTSDVLSSFSLSSNTYPVYFVGSQRGFELSALWIE